MLMRQALDSTATHADVKVLCVLPYYEEVNVLGGLILKGRLHALEEPHQPQVNVLVEVEPQPEEYALLQYAGLDFPLIAQRAQEHRPVIAQLLERVLGDRLARF